jgi:acetoin utilization deacetylase AcuC-like enzyme
MGLDGRAGQRVKVTAFVSHEDCPRHDTGWEHADHQGRLPGIVRAVYKDMVALFDPLLELEAVPASADDLLLVHTPEHVDRVRAAAADAEVAGAIGSVDGVRLSGASWDAALAAAGAGITAGRAVVAGDARNAFCLVRPAGRDATADHAAEFSLFNNVAIAARHLRASGVARVLVLDVGIRPPAAARIIGGGDGISYVSLHQQQAGDGIASATPAGIPGARWIELAAGTDGDALARAVTSALEAIPSTELPDVVVLALDLGILEGDPFGAFAVRPDDLHPLTVAVRGWADARAGGRLVSILDGGYARGGLGRAVVQHLRGLAGLEPAP